MNVEYRGVWTLSEVRDGRIHPVSYELLAWGRDLADTLGVPLRRCSSAPASRNRPLT